MIHEPLSLVQDFRRVAELALASVPVGAIALEALPALHRPPSSLPAGKMAVYVFVWKGQCLKVGKVGPKSQARYTSQHYAPSSSASNLARSLLGANADLALSDLTESNVGHWIRTNVDRVNFLLDVQCGVPVLTLLESFLQCRLNPKFEGFESQR